MKLWRVIQWGNKAEGGNGYDTNCVVSAKDMESAINCGELHFSQMYDSFKGGEADVIQLMGEDKIPDGESKLIIPNWLAPAFNLGKFEAWYRDHGNKEWKDEDTVYGYLKDR